MCAMYAFLRCRYLSGFPACARCRERYCSYGACASVTFTIFPCAWKPLPYLPVPPWYPAAYLVSHPLIRADPGCSGRCGGTRSCGELRAHIASSLEVGRPPSDRPSCCVGFGDDRSGSPSDITRPLPCLQGRPSFAFDYNHVAPQRPRAIGHRGFHVGGMTVAS